MTGLAFWTFKVLRAGWQGSPDRSHWDDGRFRFHADNATDLFYRYRLGPEAGYEYVSPSSTAITGYSPEEHYADPDLGLRQVHPDDRHLLKSSGRFSEEPLLLRDRKSVV